MLAGANLKMMFNLWSEVGRMIKIEISEQELLYGHKACPGCGAAISSRLAMKIVGDNTFLAYPASCMSTVTSIYPQMNFNIPSMTAPFAATGSAVRHETGANAKGRGRYDSGDCR